MGLSDVTKLAPVARPVDPGLVELLRDLLAMAERGEIVSLMGVTQLVAGEVSHFRHMGEGTRAADMAWALDNLKFRWLATIHLDRL